MPYLVGLSARGWKFVVVSFEKATTATREAKSAIAAASEQAGISWTPLRYHNKPAVIATAYDVLRGWGIAAKLSRECELIHARSTVPALMARLTLNRPWIFDLRGLLAEEYVDASHWPRRSLRYLVTAGIERHLLRRADGVVTLTHRIVERLPAPAASIGGRSLATIPCSVDLDQFQPSSQWRRSTRQALGWKASDRALVYSGSLGSWYRLDEMLDFFTTAREQIGQLRFLFLTPQVATILDAARSRGLDDAVSAISLAPGAVPPYLAACDAGLCFLGKYASKLASSPTKYGEYLAAGLPVITNPWIGDASYLGQERAWILVDDFGHAAYRRAAARLDTLLAVPETVRTAARALASREFALGTAIDRYDALYRQVLGQ